VITKTSDLINEAMEQITGLKDVSAGLVLLERVKQLALENERDPKDGEASTPSAPIDWEKIAIELFNKVRFAVEHFKVQGSGLVWLNPKEDADAKMIHWKLWFADALEMMPGVKVNRDALFSDGRKSKAKKKAEVTK
jgi:hypothetical protein